MLELTRDEATKNGVSVRTQFAEPSPVVQADRVQLQQVILNLIINAIEGNEQHARRSTRIADLYRESGLNGALVAVRDSGPGLDLRECGPPIRGLLHYQGPHRGARRADVGPARMNLGGASFQFTLPLERDESVPAGPVSPGTPVCAVKHGMPFGATCNSRAIVLDRSGSPPRRANECCGPHLAAAEKQVRKSHNESTIRRRSSRHTRLAPLTAAVSGPA